jgi:hypothetical protein
MTMGFLSTTLEGADPDLPSPLIRVRTGDRRIQAALAKGAEQSAAFREVLDRVQSGDVIAYIELQPRLRGRLWGVLKWMGATTRVRYVRIDLNPFVTRHQLIATLAHELQHVAEIGDAPSVVNERTLSAFYRDVGRQTRADSEVWDTEAAQLTGEIVQKELDASASDRELEPARAARVIR